MRLIPVSGIENKMGDIIKGECREWHGYPAQCRFAKLSLALDHATGPGGRIRFLWWSQPAQRRPLKLLNPAVSGLRMPDREVELAK
jgi:hypothetical protein